MEIHCICWSDLESFMLGPAFENTKHQTPLSQTILGWLFLEDKNIVRIKTQGGR